MRRSEAIRCRNVIERAAQLLDDATALTAVTLYPRWLVNADYDSGYKVRSDGDLFRCLQAHTSQAGWEPEKAVSLWERIEESHNGTVEDPIPYSGNMALTAGLYYMQDHVVYLCIRDTGIPVYQDLADLLGLYVQINP